MSIKLVTDRIILRELEISDLENFHFLETDETILKYYGNYPKRNILETKDLLNYVIAQYEKFNTGRLAIIHKINNEYMGWCGIKYNEQQRYNYTNYYDLGYRLKPEFWGKGFATEASKVCIQYGFEELKINKIHAIVNIENKPSINVIEKLGKFNKEKFIENNCHKYWYSIINDHKEIKDEFENINLNMSKHKFNIELMQ